MGPEVVNKNKNCVFNAPYAGRDLYITMYQDSEREFVVTHNANIKPVSYFTGRETELQELRQRIEEGRKSVLVSGMGGIGKTQICRKLFEEYYISHDIGGDGPFSHIGYIEYSGDMDSSLMKCLKYKEQDNPELNKEAAWRELEDLASEGNLLLFVDNVYKSGGADAGLKRLNTIPGAVVLTSRRTSLGKEFEQLKIGFLSTEQCKKIYQRIRYGDNGKNVAVEEMQDLEYVIKKLAAAHTITVEFLAHLAGTKCWTVKVLREELESKGFRLEYRDEEDKLINIQEEYEKLYNLSELSKAERNVLEAFSVFPYIPLAADVCNQWLFSDARVREGADILTGLYSKGWLQFDIERESYALHPVFAQFIYEKCKPKIKKHSGLIDSCRKSLEIGKDSVLKCQRFIPFAESIIEKVNIEERMLQFEHIYDFYNSLKNIPFINKIFIKLQENKWEGIVWLTFTLLELLDFLKRYEEKEKWCKLFVKMLVDIYGENNPIIADANLLLVNTYINMNEYEKAETLCKKNIDIYEKAHGENHLSVVNSYIGLADVYTHKREYEKAETLYTKVVKIHEKESGKNHPDTANAYECLACLYSNKGENKKAEQIQKISIGILKKTLEENHPDIAQAYGSLAYFHCSEGEYGNAEELYIKSIKILKESLGETHLDTANAYNNLAMFYREQKDYEKAENLFLRSIKIYESILGENNFSITDIYVGLALTYYEHGELREALNYFFKGYYIETIRLKHVGLNSKIVFFLLKQIYEELNPKGNFEQWLEEQMKE